MYLRLYYIKQCIPKFVIADDREATFEGQSSQPENSGDTLTEICVEVKRHFLSEYLEIIPSNKMCLNVF